MSKKVPPTGIRRWSGPLTGYTKFRKMLNNSRDIRFIFSQVSQPRNICMNIYNERGDEFTDLAILLHPEKRAAADPSQGRRRDR